MIAGKKIYEQIFTAGNYKSAYLKACKWYASTVLAKNNSECISEKIEKLKGGQSVKLTLYIIIDADEMKEKHCKICEEMRGAFFISGNKHACESCALPPFKKRLCEKIGNIEQLLKEKEIV